MNDTQSTPPECKICSLCEQERPNLFFTDGAIHCSPCELQKSLRTETCIRCGKVKKASEGFQRKLDPPDYVCFECDPPARPSYALCATETKMQTNSMENTPINTAVSFVDASLASLVFAVILNSLTPRTSEKRAKSARLARLYSAKYAGKHYHPIRLMLKTSGTKTIRTTTLDASDVMYAPYATKHKQMKTMTRCQKYATSAPVN